MVYVLDGPVIKFGNQLITILLGIFDMSLANPDPALIARITVMQECAALAGMFNGIDPQSPAFPGPIARSFYYALGCGPGTPVEILAENPVEELDEAIRTAQVEDPPPPAPAEGQPAQPQTYRAASLAEKGLMRLALKFCLLKAGKAMRTDLEQELRLKLEEQRLEVEQLRKVVTERPAAAAATAAGNGTIDLDQVCSDTAEGNWEFISKEEIFDARKNWKEVNAQKQACPEDEEPSEEQLSCLKHLLISGVNPYLNFSHWGPHSMRLLREQRLIGMVFTVQGVLTQI